LLWTKGGFEPVRDFYVKKHATINPGRQPKRPMTARLHSVKRKPYSVIPAKALYLFD